MLSLSGVSAWIEVDGKELEHYGVEVDHARNQVTCWIATQAGKAFSVVFRDNVAYREHSLCSSLFLDGTKVPGKVMRPPPRIGMAPVSRTAVQNDHISSATTARPFLFSKLELTDDDDYLNQSSTHLGEIRISIHRAQALEPSVCMPTSGISGHGKVHERSKKAVTHCVSYGQEMQTETRYGTNVRYLDDVPLATFVFRYRDYDLLLANGIIPKPPPAKNEVAASEEVLDLTTEDDSDVKREPVNDAPTRKRPSLPSKRCNLGQESGSRPAKKVKREKNHVPVGEVIDLT